jgi:DNA-binding LytR/AlgR family response regulator
VLAVPPVKPEKGARRREREGRSVETVALAAGLVAPSEVAPIFAESLTAVDDPKQVLALVTLVSQWRDEGAKQRVAAILLERCRRYWPNLPEHLVESVAVNGNETPLRFLLDAARDPAAPLAVRAQVIDAAAERLGELLETVRRLADGGAALADARESTSAAGDAVVNAVPSANAGAGATGRYASRILVKQDGRMFFVKTADIDWIEADRNYVRLHVGSTAHSIRERISGIEETLDPRLFARIHRSTIVNLNRVREMQQWFSGDYVVILDDGTRLRLSRHYRDRVEKQVGV